MFMIICTVAFAIVWLAMAGLVLVLSAEHKVKPNPERPLLGNATGPNRQQPAPVRTRLGLAAVQGTVRRRTRN